MEKCDNCIYKDGNDNCIKILGKYGHRTPCDYIVDCEEYKERKETKPNK
ncbi:MAG: hypothetical protein ACRCX8_15930 [Sarcina sp.]